MPRLVQSPQGTSRCHVHLRHRHPSLAVFAATAARSLQGLRGCHLFSAVLAPRGSDDPPVLDRLMSQSARHSFPSRVLPALGHVLPLGVVNDQRGPRVSVRSLLRTGPLLTRAGDNMCGKPSPCLLRVGTDERVRALQSSDFRVAATNSVEGALSAAALAKLKRGPE